MGLSPTPARPGVAPAATGIIDPSTGKPVGANDRLPQSVKLAVVHTLKP